MYIYNYLDYMSLILFIITGIIQSSIVYLGFNHMGHTNKIINLLIYGIQFLSQLIATLANPGVPHKNNYVSEEVVYTMYQHMKLQNVKTIDTYRICQECNIVVKQEQNVTHCDECDICVEGNKRI